MLDLSIVVPVYNESESLETFYHRLQAVLKALHLNYEIILVNDGSGDDSFAKIKKLAAEDRHVRGISLSRNFGHQIALKAGLDRAEGAHVITLDADLQHPPELIPQLLTKQKEGFEIVYTKRIDNKNVGFFKRATAALFYRLINAVSETRIEPGAADFRLMSRKAVDAFRQLGEQNRFTRGLVGWMGFRQACISFEVDPRIAGKSKYTLRRMIGFALDGVTSFSSKPLRTSFYLGVTVSCFALLYAAYALVVFMAGKTVAGWTSILLTVLLLGGIQLISIGILGEYLARIFTEAKHRPLYLIDETVGS